VLLLAVSGVFAFWYLNTVTLTGRVVDTKGKALPYVIYGEIYRIRDGYLYTSMSSIGHVSDKGEFKIGNIRYGELCILYYYDVVKGNNTYRFDLLEKCGIVEPFEDRDVGNIVIDIDEALRLTPFEELKDSQEFVVRAKYDDKKRIMLKELL